MATPTNDITFYNSHEPQLKDGDYELNLTHNFKLAEGGPTSESLASKSVEFFVSGPRFAIPSSQIHSVFPPIGGKGDYGACLPNLVINRSTLPWERSPLIPSDEESTTLTPLQQSASWLFLLLIDESETSLSVENNGVSLSSMASDFTSPTGSASLNADDLKRLPAKFNYLSLDKSLQDLIPQSLDDLAYLSYARIKEGEEEQAVILCNRLPTEGSNSIVYLVSLEGYYNSDAPFVGNLKVSTSPDSFILPYFHKWDFYSFKEELFCITEPVKNKILANPSIQNVKAKELNTAGLYNKLKTTKSDFESALNTAGITDASNVKLIEKLAKLPGSNFHELLTHLEYGFSALSVPNGLNSSLAETGSLCLPNHKLSQNPITTEQVETETVTLGGEYKIAPTQSWYRGPLVGAPVDLTGLSKFPLNESSIKSSIRAEDFNLTVNGVTDLTYAAAFELGRLTALDDVIFSTAFYRWKNQTAVLSRSENPPHPLNPLDNFKTLKDQFDAWKKLKGIPYRYLLAEPNLLPAESIRYFYLDPYWVNAFICGAFSIGHTISVDLTDELKGLFLPMPITVESDVDATTPAPNGFLIHSLAVSGWPTFQVDLSYTYNQKNPPKGHAVQKTKSYPTITHQDSNNLSPNTALFLLNEPFTQLDFHLHPAKVHSGLLVTENSDKQTVYEKVLSSKLTKKNQPITIAVKLGSHNQITPSDVAAKLKTPDAANFGAAMLEGLVSVSFTINTPSS
jgi:hypothetical protein